MSLNEPQESKEARLEALKLKLDEFIGHNSITKFEGEDIVELVGEGEALDWIVDQLKGNNPDVAADEIAPILIEIKKLVGPAEEPSAPEPVEESGDRQPSGIPEELSGMPDLSRIDPSKLDLSQLVDALPANMKLPHGFDVQQLKNLMESPQGKVMTDFILFCQEKGVEIDEGALNDPRTKELQDEWKSTPREAFDGKTPAEMLGGSGGLIPEKVKTFRREEPRVGRNDPCPCGSGRKYKKCCGRGQ
jgi:hypothetical protein